MSEIPNMISSLVDDNKIDAETHFKNSIAQKIGSALDLKRVEVANSLIKGQLNTSVEDSADEEI
jgi:hypothetical protein|tara:strand:+ start:353 stop:544 length:192 start_codon:yes stop_codon:yes gene_type:complete